MTNDKSKQNRPVPGGCTGPACSKPYEPTPQAREGPFGPKTLCNACGVHYNRHIKKQPLHQQEVAREAAFHVFNCYQTSPECAASLPLHPDELLRRIRTLQDAMLVPTQPAAAVGAPGTPPQAAAAAAAPEWSDAGSQEEVVEEAGPAQLKLFLSKEDKEDPSLCQYVEETVASYNKSMLEVSELVGADRTAAEEELGAALVIWDINLAAHQVAQHSPNTLELKRGLEEQQQGEEEDQDYYTPRAAAPKRARTGPRMPRHHHQQQQQKVPFLALPPGMLTTGEGLGEDKAGAAGAAAGNNHNVVAAPQQQVAAGGMEVAGGAGAGVAAGQGQQQQQQEEEDVVMAAAAVPAHVLRHSGRAARPPKKLEAFVRSPAKEVFRRV